MPLLPAVAGAAMAALLAAGCEPRVRLEAPEKPIVINLNVNIQQEVRIKIEKDVEDLLETNESLF